MSILIYTPVVSSRVKYAFYVVLREVLGANELTFTTNLEDIETHQGAVLSYCKEEVEGAIRFWPHGLLNEKDISEQEIFMGKHREMPTFFAVSNSALPFDVFAASFYMVSRYEEYLPHISDTHNRFLVTESLAYKNDFLKIPLVNIWAKWVKEIILERFPITEFQPKPYRFISTVDVDNLFAYKSKGVLRTFGALIKDFIFLKWNLLSLRLRCTFGFVNDPYDTFEKQMDANDVHKIKSIYFILFAEFAQFDRNISMFSPRMHEAVRGMNDFTEVAIHPSYRSNEKEKIVESELRNMEEALRTRVKKSRQHFLKMRFPDTFSNLVELGITDEYSMGYASEPGFRAGIATPFTFYDLEMEVPVPLTMHPFMVMDVTFIDYKKTTNQVALEEMKVMVDAVKAVDGQFVSVFHNRVFSEREPEWHGWFTLYKELLDYAKP